MRTWILTALALATVGLLDARPASARTCQTCSGPGASAKSATARAHHASKRRSHQTASASHHSRRHARAHDGGSSAHSGMASYYHEPQRLASGDRFNPNALTAAHKTLPFGTKVRVTNNRNGQSVVVTINDRGPYVGGRVIDLSAAAAGAINMKSAGVAPVSLAVLGR